MPASLTAKQQRLLDYLQKWIAESGDSPSLRQAAQDLGISHTAVAQTLKRLEEKGFIKREGRYGRTVHLINQAGQPAGLHRWREVPVIGRITAGLRKYPYRKTTKVFSSPQKRVNRSPPTPTLNTYLPFWTAATTCSGR